MAEKQKSSKQKVQKDDGEHEKNEQAKPSFAERVRSNAPPASVKPAVGQEDLQSKVEELQDKWKRSVAEIENVKRRAGIDVQNARQFSIEAFARDLLGVLDSLQRAYDSVSAADAEADERLKNVKDGVEITKKELVGVFERNGVRCVDPLGEKFDHNLHQAMTQVEQEDKESGVVVQVMQVGYTIKDRLLRPALVAVAK